MSKIDLMRRRQNRDGPGAPVAPIPLPPIESIQEPRNPPKGGSSTAPQKSERKQKVSTDGPLPVNHSCGHPIALKQLANQKCPKCRNDEREGKAKAHREKREQAKVAHYSRQDAGRLPDQSRLVDVVYDAASETWSGSLVIPGHFAITGKESGLWTLLRNLDLKYRELLAGKGGET